MYLHTMRILFVCLGNICRSPIADGWMRHKVATESLNWIIDSAGTESYHIGEAPHPQSQRVCRDHGLDISGLRARQFQRSDFEQFDVIYAMSGDVLNELIELGGSSLKKGQVRLFLDEDPQTQGQSVTDPWYGPPEGYDAVFEVIAQGAQAIFQTWLLADKAR